MANQINLHNTASVREEYTVLVGCRTAVRRLIVEDVGGNTFTVTLFGKDDDKGNLKTFREDHV